MFVCSVIEEQTGDAVLQEAQRLMLDLLWYRTNGGDSLLDELNAAFDTDELLEQTAGREELAAAVEQLQLGGEVDAVIVQLMTGCWQRIFVLASDYERIVGARNVSGWSSDYATEATRTALWHAAAAKEDEPLMNALEQRWAPLELVAQDEHTVTVRDWRYGETWRWDGVATIDELNASLRNENSVCAKALAVEVEYEGLQGWTRLA